MLYNANHLKSGLIFDNYIVNKPTINNSYQRRLSVSLPGYNDDDVVEITIRDLRKIADAFLDAMTPEQTQKVLETVQLRLLERQFVPGKTSQR